MKTVLRHWGLEDADCELVAQRENQVYRIEHGHSVFALRVHRKGYRSIHELECELQWMAALYEAGIHVPEPVPTNEGHLVELVNGFQSDMLSWLDGKPMGSAKSGLDIPDRENTFHQLGKEMARMHLASDRTKMPDNFSRPSWNRSGLLGDNALWGRFWENPTLSSQDRKLFLQVKYETDSHLAELESSLDFGLIHADLVRENVIIDDGKIQFIDFDDGGFGFRLFDVATTLLASVNEPDFDGLKDGLLRGYRSVRGIDTDALDLFMLLRSATYVGWVSDRLEEDGSEERNARFIKRTKMLAERYFS